MKVWVECVGAEMQPVRICRRPPHRVGAFYLLDKREVVGAIRRQILERQHHECLRCGALISEESMHMHEKIHRGRGGEISLENSVGLCADCHIGRSGEHGSRRPQFTRRRHVSLHRTDTR